MHYCGLRNGYNEIICITLFFKLERLLKHTPEGNEDLNLLPEVISKLDEQIKKLNDSIAAAEFQSIVSTLTFKHPTENNIPYGATQLFYKGNVKCKSAYNNFAHTHIT